MCDFGRRCKNFNDTCDQLDGANPCFTERAEATDPGGLAVRCSDLLCRMRGYEVDHTPDGWPAVKMRDVSALCQMIEGAKELKKNPMRLAWNPDGYWLDGKLVGDIEDAFYLAVI